MNRRGFFRGVIGMMGVAVAAPAALFRKTVATVKRKVARKVEIRCVGGGGGGGSGLHAGSMSGGNGIAPTEVVHLIYDDSTGEELKITYHSDGTIVRSIVIPPRSERSS